VVAAVTAVRRTCSRLAWRVALPGHACGGSWVLCEKMSVGRSSPMNFLNVSRTDSITAKR
jgi:hypothetical protein